MPPFPSTLALLVAETRDTAPAPVTGGGDCLEANALGVAAGANALVRAGNCEAASTSSTRSTPI
ncbi:hypothetical protein PAHAL_2G430400 [Panicum hallii]|uniref:Uncharacterized protein n=1 Tax=Panicum hallii TaxID=206008 RepID=A0A2S3H3K4_9POAL|nr:hypothetical protein PAHAL_2G430400 [Panicum hallii]